MTTKKKLQTKITLLYHSSSGKTYTRKKNEPIPRSSGKWIKHQGN